MSFPVSVSDFAFDLLMMMMMMMMMMMTMMMTMMMVMMMMMMMMMMMFCFCFDFAFDLFFLNVCRSQTKATTHTPPPQKNIYKLPIVRPWRLLCYNNNNNMII